MSSRSRTIRRSAHLSVAVLALWGLTACGTEESEPDESTGAIEEVTEDGTEPGQDQTAGSDGDEEPDEADAEPPEFEEVREAIWSASQAQDSVRIAGDMVDPTSGVNPEAFAEDGQDATSGETSSEDSDSQSDEDSAAAEPELVPLLVYGDLAGEASAFELGDVYEYLLFGEDILQSVDSVVMEYEVLQPEGTEAPDPEEIRDAFSAAGSWAHVGPAAQGLIETPGLFLSNLEQGFAEAQEQAEDDSATEWSAEADVHNGQDVWVFSRGEAGDGSSITVAADEDEPLLVHLGYQYPGQPVTSIEFLDWNETEGPERPDEDEVISPEEVQMILQEMGG